MTEHAAENDAIDCRCATPKPDGRGNCSTCGRFACEYANRGRTRCSPSICDCFIDTYPDSPRALHPEAFTPRRAIPPEWCYCSEVEVDDITGPEPHICSQCGNTIKPWGSGV